MTTAQAKSDGSIAPRAGPAAMSAAMAVMTLVAANRSPKRRAPGARDAAAGRDTQARGSDRDSRATLDDAATGDPAVSPAPRRLPTGLY